MPELAPRFWEQKPLHALSPDEWEALCDGCAKCCLQKLEDEDSGEVVYTRLACHLLDISTCRCSAYTTRTDQVADCVKLTPADVDAFHWLPRTCAYRLVAEGRPLFPWHPLLSGDPNSVHQAGISMIDKVIPNTAVPEHAWETQVIRWVE